MTRRLVFAALVAFTDVASKDGRVLVTPPGFMCPVRDYPLPVYGPDAETGAAYRVGSIESASVVDRRIIVFGRLDLAKHAKPFIDQLRAGTHRLEIDVIDPEVADDNGPLTTFTRWTLAAAHVGDRPCWNLPPVQMEELTCL